MAKKVWMVGNRPGGVVDKKNYVITLTEDHLSGNSRVMFRCGEKDFWDLGVRDFYGKVWENNRWYLSHGYSVVFRDRLGRKRLIIFNRI